MRFFRNCFFLLLLIGIIGGGWYWYTWDKAVPSLDRDWIESQAILPSAEINGRAVSVKNIRNFNYRTETDFDAKYYDAVYDLGELTSVWYIISPFSSWEGPAHTMVSFGFSDGRYVAISVEVRKEKGETYSPYRGLLPEYELMYVVADEADVIKLRTNIRTGERVYVYPVRTSTERKQQLFVDMLTHVNELQVTPEWYHTLIKNCTNTLARHVNSIVPGRVHPWDWRIVLPGYSDKLAWQIGLLDVEGTFDEVRATYFVNEKAQMAAELTGPAFSKAIRP